MSTTEQPHPYIVFDAKLPGRAKYRCTVCVGSRAMQHYDRHINCPSHLEALAHYVADQDQQHAEHLMNLDFAIEHSPPREPHQHFADHQSDRSSSKRPPSPLSFNPIPDGDDPLGLFDNSDAEGDSGELDFIKLQQAFEELGGDATDSEDPDDDEDYPAGDADEAGSWYPFKNVQHVVGVLMIGSPRNLLSRTDYLRLRMIFTLLKVKLPAWNTLRSACKKIKEQMGLDLTERFSPAGIPLFGINIKTVIKNELANPLVSPHLAFVPELVGDGPISELSQCAKWRQGFPPELRVPMITQNGIHFYIYEPVQLHTQQLVVPVFFYQHLGKLVAKCLPAKVQPNSDDVRTLKITFPAEPDFDSESLMTLPCTDFWRPFGDIKLSEIVFLKDLCGESMYRTSTFLISNQDLPSAADCVCFASPEVQGATLLPIAIQNKWRIKADGKTVRHVPLVLYSDDTSGNVSKKWNKHMSLYVTLAGLPSKLSNQEFNIHFLSTSNLASALDMFDQVVNDINDMAENGLVTYDQALGEDVLAMGVVLFHAGDSPMHAEICNTLNPANTLTPCRMCELQVDRKLDKESSGFVRDFLGIDEDGHPARLPFRQWDETRARTEELWHTAQRRHTKTLIENLGRKYGVRDTVLDYFIKIVQKAHETQPAADVQVLINDLNREHGFHLFNPMLRLKGFNGHLDTPVEILHVVLLGITKYLFRDTMKQINPAKAGSKIYNDLSGRWRAFNKKGLNIPPIQPHTFINFYQNLVGKEFRTVLQAVPFVIFDYLSPETRAVWSALCCLSSYVFQTEITDMNRYLAELDILISHFLQLLVSLTAQWVNKPKFHMLIHLQDSIRRFGPACLFATEKFESFNGKTRQASIHSNKQAPGFDIANTFANEQMLRILLSGSSFFDKVLQMRVTAGDDLKNLFMKLPDLAQAFGLCKPKRGNQVVMGAVVEDNGRPPLCVLQTDTHNRFQSFTGLSLPNRQKLERNDFVFVESIKAIAQVKSIWKEPGVIAERAWLVLNPCVSGRVVPYYNMREVVLTNQDVCHSVKDVSAILNIQHNCYEGKCEVTMCHMLRMERVVSRVRGCGIQHRPVNSFIINSASQLNGELHRRLANVQYRPVTASAWNNAVDQGLNEWDQHARVPAEAAS